MVYEKNNEVSSIKGENMYPMFKISQEDHICENYQFGETESNVVTRSAKHNHPTYDSEICYHLKSHLNYFNSFIIAYGSGK